MRNIGGILIVLLIALAFIVPYTVLSGVSAWYGSFLWWLATGVLVIVANAMFTKDWGDRHE